MEKEPEILQGADKQSIQDMLKEAVNATTKLADTLIKKLLERSREDNDGYVGSGYRALNVSIEGGEITRKKKEEEKTRKFIERFGKQVLKELEARMEWLRAERDKVDEGLSAIERLQKRKQNGTFNNSDQDKEDLALLGVTEDQFLGENGDAIIQRKKNDFEARKAWIDEQVKKGQSIKTPEEFKEFMDESDSAVFAQMRISEIDEQLKENAKSENNNTFTTETNSISAQTRNALDDWGGVSSVANFSGMAPGIESKNGDIPINEHFAVSADPRMEDTDSAVTVQNKPEQDFNIT